MQTLLKLEEAGMFVFDLVLLRGSASNGGGRSSCSLPSTWVPLAIWPGRGSAPSPTTHFITRARLWCFIFLVFLSANRI